MKKIFVVGIIVLFLASGIGIFGNEVKGESKNGYISHEPIYINGNENFTYGNGVVSGDGSKENPYIIENWDIIPSGYINGGIEIRNTNVYFIIRNCKIHDGKEEWIDGISISNTTNGKIENVISYNNADSGISIYSKSENITITNSNLYNNGNGIDIISSSYNQITNNNVYNNKDDGIKIMFIGYNNLVSYNNIYNNTDRGIFFKYSGTNNQITNNNIFDNYYGIYFEGSSNYNYIYLNNFINNTIQAYDNDINFWNSTNKGNYWSVHGGWVRELNETGMIGVFPPASRTTPVPTFYQYNVKENALESYVNLTSLSNNSGEDLDLTVYDPKGDVAGSSAGPTANEQIHLKKKDMERGGSGEWEVEIQVFNGTIIEYQITVDVLYNKTLIVDSNNDGIGDTPYSISGGNNKDNYPLMKPNPNAGVQIQNPTTSETKNEFPILYIILGVITIIIAIILISFFFIRRNKPKQIPKKFSPQIERHPFATYQNDNIPYSHPEFYEEYYKQNTIQTICPNCKGVFQINNSQKEIECPYCKTKGVIK